MFIRSPRIWASDSTVRMRWRSASPARRASPGSLRSSKSAESTPASAVKETTWVLDIESWRANGTPVRRAFYNGEYPASTLVEIPGLARAEFLVEIEVIAAVG